MATFKFVLDSYVKADGKQSIQLRITVNRQVIPRSTGYAVKKKDWDKANQKVKPSNTNHVSINDALKAKYEAAEREFATAEAQGYTPTAKAVADKTFTTHDFHEHAQGYINTLTGPTQLRTQKGYQSTANSIKAFSPTLAVEQVTPDLIKSYRKFMESTPRSISDPRPLGRTTIIKRLNHFKALYNLSPHKKTPSPFEQIVIGESRPANKEPLTISEITAFWNYHPKSPAEQKARDMFLFSFYAMGMRIGDVIMMKWSYLKEDRIVYPQSKKEHQGNNLLSIPRNKFLDEIISRWPQRGEYLFQTITKENPRDILQQVEAIQARTNFVLKQIAVSLKIDKWVAAKLARSTFADIANKRTNRNIYAIQQSMGHTRVSTTEIYVGRDLTAVDEVARKTYGD